MKYQRSMLAVTLMATLMWVPVVMMKDGDNGDGDDTIDDNGGDVDCDYIIDNDVCVPTSVDEGGGVHGGDVGSDNGGGGGGDDGDNDDDDDGDDDGVWMVCWW